MSPSFPARGLLGLIQVYKWTLSPLVGRGCRYLPTCSSYAADAIRRHGAWPGGWMAAARLCRCHPWGGSGYDPAPAALKPNSWWRPWRYGDWAWRTREPQSPLPRGEDAVRSTAGEGRANDPASDASARPSPPTPSPQGRGGDHSARVIQ
ncbi:MAG: membrane protein insertion efficiency factor YidD [Alphaproteobacteria bacterium]